METHCQDFPVCPYCGHIHQDAFEWSGRFDMGARHDCDECGKEFQALREVSVSWDTNRVADSETASEQKP